MRVTKKAPQKFHFIGICGTAMGSVAAALRERGFTISGSDESVYPPMSIFLEEHGIKLHQGYNPENIPADADVVVIGNAMKRGNPENLGRGARLNDSKYFVIEGDEYDSAFFDKRSKFVHYLPELVIVNNIEFDHADIFKNIDEIKLSFKRLLNIVPQNGMVLLNGDDHNCVEVAKDCRAQLVEVGFSKNCGQRIRDVAY